MASFRIKFPEKEEPSIIVLKGARITVGRLPENTIQIVDRVISSTHAELVAEDGHYRLRDLDSTNGTYVNGQAVRDYHLREACKVEFGSIECEFSPEAPAEDASSEVEALPTRGEMNSLRQENEALKAQVEALREELDALHQVRPMSGEEAALAVPKAEFEKVTADREVLKVAQQRHHQEIARLKENLALLRRDRENLQRAWEITKAELNVFRPGGTPPPSAAPSAAAPKPTAIRAVPVAKPPGFTPAPIPTGAPAPAPTSRPALPPDAAPKPATTPAIPSTPAIPNPAGTSPRVPTAVPRVVRATQKLSAEAPATPVPKLVPRAVAKPVAKFGSTPSAPGLTPVARPQASPPSQDESAS